MLHTAIILAGGFGTRLQSVVNNVPKPMAPVAGRAFLDYQLLFLKYHGIKKVVLSTGYLGEVILNHYQNNFNGIAIEYSEEKEPLGTGGGIRMALERCEEKETLVINGDSFFEVDMKLFYEFHKKNSADVSLSLREVEDASRYGTIVADKSGRIISFREKNGVKVPGLINGGVYVINREAFLSNTPAKKNFSVEKDFFETQLNSLSVYGMNFSGYFLDIGIPEDYNKAQLDFKEFKY